MGQPRPHAYPPTPEDLSAAWLTDRLRADGALKGEAKVSWFETTPIGAGSGFMGRLVRVTLGYDGDAHAAPQTLIAKFAADPGHHRDIAMAFRLYHREVVFYQKIAASFPGAAPHCYAAEIDAATGDSVLLLEDLGAYETGDQAKGCSADEARMIIDILAPMHARYWGRSQEVDWAPPIDGSVQIDGASGGCAMAWDPCAQRFGHRMAPKLLAHRDVYLAAIPALHRRMAQPVQTLVHGDIRLDNLMFGASAAHRPVVALDWIVGRSAAVQDLAYLLSQNVRIEERRTHEAALVSYYHARLIALGITDYTLDQLWADYRYAVLFLFSYAILITGALDPTNERGAQMMEQLVHRAASAVMDHDLLPLLQTLPA